MELLVYVFIDIYPKLVFDIQDVACRKYEIMISICLVNTSPEDNANSMKKD